MSEANSKSGKKKYDVARILDMELRGQTTMIFHVDWVGYEEKTWEPLSSFDDGLDNPAIRQFREYNPEQFEAIEDQIKKNKKQILQRQEERHETVLITDSEDEDDESSRKRTAEFVFGTSRSNTNTKRMKRGPLQLMDFFRRNDPGAGTSRPGPFSSSREAFGEPLHDISPSPDRQSTPFSEHVEHEEILSSDDDDVEVPVEAVTDHRAQKSLVSSTPSQNQMAQSLRASAQTQSRRKKVPSYNVRVMDGTTGKSIISMNTVHDFKVERIEKMCIAYYNLNTSCNTVEIHGDSHLASQTTMSEVSEMQNNSKRLTLFAKLCPFKVVADDGL